MCPLPVVHLPALLGEDIPAESVSWHGDAELLGTSSQKRRAPWTTPQSVVHEAQGEGLWRSGCFREASPFYFQKIKRNLNLNWCFLTKCSLLGSSMEKHRPVIRPLPNTSEKSVKSVCLFEASSSKVLRRHPAVANFRCSCPHGATHSPRRGI